MAERSHLHGLLAEFSDPDALLAAARRSRAAGFRRLNAFTPFPVDGLAELVAEPDRRVPLLMLAGGIGGAALGYGMQVYTNLDYLLNVGGRGLLPVPAFMLITFEFLMLGAVGAGILGMLLLNRLPRLHHPLFAVDAFRDASLDKFFLLLRADDPGFDPDGTAQFLEALKPLSVAAVPPDEPA